MGFNKSHFVKLKPNEQNTGIIIKIAVPRSAGNINIQPEKRSLFNKFLKNVFMVQLYNIGRILCKNMNTLSEKMI